MRISLAHQFFTEDPYKAFAKRYDCSPKLWYEIYNQRFIWHQYEIPILCEYFKLKTKMDINDRTIRRWIKRTQIYNRAQDAIKKGVKDVSYTYFDMILTEHEFTELLS
jgi:hypothetical protein